MPCSPKFSLLAFGSSSQESPERGGWAYLLGLAFFIWKVPWWIYYSSSNCRKEECIPDGSWNSAGASLPPHAWAQNLWQGLGTLGTHDNPAFVPTVSEESMRDLRTGNDWQWCLCFKLFLPSSRDYSLCVLQTSDPVPILWVLLEQGSEVVQAADLRHLETQPSKGFRHDWANSSPQPQHSPLLSSILCHASVWAWRPSQWVPRMSWSQSWTKQMIKSPGWRGFC